MDKNSLHFHNGPYYLSCSVYYAVSVLPNESEGAILLERGMSPRPRYPGGDGAPAQGGALQVEPSVGPGLVPVPTVPQRRRGPRARRGPTDAHSA